MPGSSTSSDDGRVVGHLLLFVGLVLLAVGAVACASVLLGGVGGGPSYAPKSSSDGTVVLLGFGALIVGGLLATVGALVAKSVPRTGAHRSYGTYLDDDDDDF